MADQPVVLDEPGAESPSAEVEARPEAPARRRRMKLDHDEIVTHVLAVVEEAQRARSTQMLMRTERYAKMRGWREAKNYPWDDASNAHIPIIMADCLRVEAGLYNAVMGIRPPMTPKPARKELKERADRANQLIDHQMFVENSGEEWVEQLINRFVEDGTVFSYQPWVKDRRRMHDVRVQPRPRGIPLAEAMVETIPMLWPSAKNLVLADDDGHHWTATFTDDDGHEVEIEVRVYEQGKTKIEIVATWEAVVFSGPTTIVDSLEDIVVPLRCENPQPPSPQNPRGAPWIARLSRVSVDTIRRRQQDGTYDLLDDEDTEEIEATAGDVVPQGAPNNEDMLKSERDALAGTQPLFTSSDDEHGYTTLVTWHGGWDVNDDDLDEEVIFTVDRDARKLLRARYLTEDYPGLPVRRPFAHAVLIPVEGEIYGIGYPELMEGLHDLLHTLVNQNLDAGSITNTPFGFYRASSGIKPDVQRLEPGVLYPVDNPQTDVNFPVLPQRDQSWSFNMIGLTMQFLSDLTQIGPLQKGQVPQGKASALRTLGTTMAILQQGAAMPEQILRRLFRGIRQVWAQFHLLNMRYLPKRKEYLIVGKSLDQDEAYGVIEDPTDIAVPIDFDFQATLLNTNKGLVAQALQALGAAIFNPMSLQMGTIDAERFYNWQRDLVQSQSMDPSRYVKKPAGVPDAPRMTGEEAILLLTEGRLPSYSPLEDPQEHYQKILDFVNHPEQFGLLHPGYVMLAKEYLRMALDGARQAVQRQQMMRAAEAFGQMLANQGQGQGSQPGELPPTQTQAPEQSEIAGANGAHG